MTKTMPLAGLALLTLFTTSLASTSINFGTVTATVKNKGTIPAYLVDPSAHPGIPGTVYGMSEAPFRITFPAPGQCTPFLFYGDGSKTTDNGCGFKLCLNGHGDYDATRSFPQRRGDTVCGSLIKYYIEKKPQRIRSVEFSIEFVPFNSPQ